MYNAAGSKRLAVFAFCFIPLTWQVEGKLGTWISRKKRSDFQDLAFLFRKYGKEIRQWSEHLSEDWRREF
ncbi:Squalene monooxygenase [Fusarium oxysporum f. sp. albedinis]|nr:Squalene monooxygenase [Fusarium oxysporum f. sp. albedinis]